ncbi:hypothetical protein [[Mycobacterium] crassicus]|uniref:DUF222 domain-containing protein n=1 Tax=[Mycobacterium] crassicus TaxID=2872309 RepID=A0ABU5XL40_9MYCO|nr:hypothetical protein [Mycolicibacter sp. MYC098]MEB3023003.1 hypothetical protein [Mycolicibacter sp. MYC098]
MFIAVQREVLAEVLIVAEEVATLSVASALPVMRDAAAKVRACISEGRAIELATAGNPVEAQQLGEALAQLTHIADVCDQQVAQWETLLAGLSEPQDGRGVPANVAAYREDVIARLETETPPVIHERITAKCDANGVVTALRIDPAALGRLSRVGMGRAIAVALQMAHDDMATRVMTALGSAPLPRGPADGAGFIEAFGGGELMVAVDDHGRTVACEIGSDAAGWDVGVLDVRITQLVRLAQLRARREMFRPLNAWATKYGYAHRGPTLEDITACRAALDAT